MADTITTTIPAEGFAIDHREVVNITPGKYPLTRDGGNAVELLHPRHGRVLVDRYRIIANDKRNRQITGTLTEAQDLTIGDIVDLEGDIYANDPDDLLSDFSGLFVFEYAEVYGFIDESNPLAITVHFVTSGEDHVVAFPKHHLINVVLPGLTGSEQDNDGS